MYIHTYIYVYIYIYIIHIYGFLLKTIYGHYTVFHGLIPIFRWLQFILFPKNKNKYIKIRIKLFIK